MPSFLKIELKTIQNIKYWNIKGVKNNPVNLYLDGVHFNQECHIRCYRCVRGAIIQAITYPGSILIYYLCISDEQINFTSIYDFIFLLIYLYVYFMHRFPYQ
jgi:hypothetical protein